MATPLNLNPQSRARYIFTEKNTTMQFEIDTIYDEIDSTNNKLNQLRTYADSTFLKLAGGTMTGELNAHHGLNATAFTATTATISTSSTIGGISIGKVGTNNAKAIKDVVDITAIGVITSPSFVGELTGNASSATKLKTARTISISNHASGSASFNGTSDINIAITLAASGATAGTYGPSVDVTGANGTKINVPEVKVDAYGRVTSISNKVYTSIDTHWTSHLKVANSATATSNVAATNGNVYLNIMDDTTVRDSHKIIGTGGTTVTSDANGNITISSVSTTGSSTTSGLTKLYSSEGANTDGAMTQKVDTEAHTTIRTSVSNLNTYVDNTFLRKDGGTVTGTLILAKATDASDTSNNSPALIVGGIATNEHLELDGNEIIAKSNATTGSTLYLNPNDGLVSVGQGGITTSGNVTAAQFIGALVGTVTGNAESASKWVTARKLTIGNTGKNVNGTSDVSWSLAEIGAVSKSGDTMSGELTIKSADTSASKFKVQSTSNSGVTTTLVNIKKSEMALADGYTISGGVINISPSEKLVITNNIETQYAITAGVFNGKLMGNASTATQWENNRTLTIGNSGKAVNGTTNVSWTLAEIGAVAKAGDTMTGALTLVKDKYSDSLTEYGLNANNSNIIGVNSIYFADNTDTSAEGIHFLQTASVVDTLWAKSGVLYFTPNRSIGSATATAYTVITSENISSYMSSGTSSNADKLTTARNIKIGNATQSFDGSANITFTLDGIGAAASTHTHSYLPLSGGTLTGNIKYTMYSSTQTPLNIYGGNSSGQGIAIGAGGTTIIGSGAAATYWRGTLSATAKQLYLSSEKDIYFTTNTSDSTGASIVILDSDSALYPSSSGTGSIGTSTYKWKTIYANTLYGSLSGNATTATLAESASKLATARNITIGSATKSFDGSSDITFTLEDIGAGTAVSGDYLPLTGGTLTGTLSASTIKLYTLRGRNIWSQTEKYFTIDSVVRFQGSSFAPDNGYDGECDLGLSGYAWNNIYGKTLHGELDGNASTATKLATARTITIGSATKSFDGSGNISFTLSEIGAGSGSVTGNYVPLSGSSSIIGTTSIPSLISFCVLEGAIGGGVDTYAIAVGRRTPYSGGYDDQYYFTVDPNGLVTMEQLKVGNIIDWYSTTILNIEDLIYAERATTLSENDGYLSLMAGHGSLSFGTLYLPTDTSSVTKAKIDLSSTPTTFTHLYPTASTESAINHVLKISPSIVSDGASARVSNAANSGFMVDEYGNVYIKGIDNQDDCKSFTMVSGYYANVTPYIKMSVQPYHGHIDLGTLGPTSSDIYDSTYAAISLRAEDGSVRCRSVLSNTDPMRHYFRQLDSTGALTDSIVEGDILAQHPILFVPFSTFDDLETQITYWMSKLIDWNEVDIDGNYGEITFYPVWIGAKHIFCKGNRYGALANLSVEYTVDSYGNVLSCFNHTWTKYKIILDFSYSQKISLTYTPRSDVSVARVVDSVYADNSLTIKNLRLRREVTYLDSTSAQTLYAFMATSNCKEFTMIDCEIYDHVILSTSATIYYKTIVSNADITNIHNCNICTIFDTTNTNYSTAAWGYAFEGVSNKNINISYSSFNTAYDESCTHYFGNATKKTASCTRPINIKSVSASSPLTSYIRTATQISHVRTTNATSNMTGSDIYIGSWYYKDNAASDVAYVYNSSHLSNIISQNGYTSYLSSDVYVKAHMVSTGSFGFPDKWVAEYY